HVAELSVSPNDIKVSLGVCLKHDSHQPFTEYFDICQHGPSCGIGWSLFKHIIHMRWLLTTLNNAADRPFLESCDGTNMRQDISRRPFPLLWRCVKGSVRDRGCRCQKLMMCLSQCFDKLLRRTTHCLTC